MYWRDHGWFDSGYYYPTRLGPLKRAAGAAFDRLAARSSRAREHHAARLDSSAPAYLGRFTRPHAGQRIIAPSISPSLSDDAITTWHAPQA